MRNTLTQFNQFKTELLTERLAEAEAMVFLLQRYTADDENRTVSHGLHLLHDSLMNILQAARLEPNCSKGGENA